MNISALEEYGLRCAARLAALPVGQTLSAPEIAEAEGLSVEYVSKFMLHLKRSELIRTVRGVHGGFALTRPPSEISLKEVFEALRGKRNSISFNGESEDFCKGFSGKESVCIRNTGCTIRPFWKILNLYIDEFTSELTLADLIQTEVEVWNRTEKIVRKNLQQLRESRRFEENAFEKDPV